MIKKKITSFRSILHKTSEQRQKKRRSNERPSQTKFTILSS